MAKPVVKARRRLTSLIFAEITLVTYFAYLSFFIVELATPYTSGFHSKFTAYLVIIPLFTFLASLAVGLYESKLRESYRGIVRRIFVAHGLAFFALMVVEAVILRNLDVHPYYLVIAACLNIVGISIFRYLLFRYHALGVGKSRIVILGAGQRAAIIEKRMRRSADRKNFELIGFIPVPGDNRDEKGIQHELLLDIDIDASFVEFIQANNIDEIVIAADQRRGTLPIEVLFDLRLQGVVVTDLLDFMEREVGQIVVDLLFPSWLIFSNGFNSQNYARQLVDNGLNWFLASLVLFFVWPFMLLTALAIYLDDGRRTNTSVFYKQIRTGKNGEPFAIYKFRSMGKDAEKDGAKWATKNDMRVTRIGGFIRKYRLDELPQLYNVFRGDMSFVGPRPERPEFVEQLATEIPFYNHRHTVKPGLAGWAQLNYPYGASVNDAREKLKFDLYYVKHQSFLLDILILIRTVEVVLFGKGQ